MYNKNWSQEKVEKFLLKIKDNNGYCPCKIVKSEENICPCLDYRTNKYCCCNLYENGEGETNE